MSSFAPSSPPVFSVVFRAGVLLVFSIMFPSPTAEAYLRALGPGVSVRRPKSRSDGSVRPSQDLLTPTPR